MQSLQWYKHHIIAAIKFILAIEFILAIKAITPIASIENTYKEYLDNVLSKSAKLYKAAVQVYGIGGYPHSVKRYLERIEKGGLKVIGIDNLTCAEKLYESFNCVCTN